MAPYNYGLLSPKRQSQSIILPPWRASDNLEPMCQFLFIIIMLFFIEKTVKMKSFQLGYSIY